MPVGERDGLVGIRFPVWMQSTGSSGVFSSHLRPNSTGKSATLEGSGVLIAHTGNPEKKFPATFRVGVTGGGPGQGTLQLTVLAPAFSALPIALPTEDVLVGQISVG